MRLSVLFAGAAMALAAFPGSGHAQPPGAAVPPPTKAALDDAASCLAMNVYWEARSEDRNGKLAVAFVTLNRAKSPDFPNDICAVVRQGGEDVRHQCQFSWWCDGKPDDPTNPVAWAEAQEIARAVLAGKAKDPTRGALYFHLDGVQPAWTNTRRRTITIGTHHFYR